MNFDLSNTIAIMTNYGEFPGFELVGITSNFKNKKSKFVVLCSRPPQNMAKGNFTSFLGRIRRREIPKTGCTCMAVFCCCLRQKNSLIICERV